MSLYYGARGDYNARVSAAASDVYTISPNKEPSVSVIKDYAADRGVNYQDVQNLLRSDVSYYYEARTGVPTTPAVVETDRGTFRAPTKEERQLVEAEIDGRTVRGTQPFVQEKIEEEQLRRTPTTREEFVQSLVERQQKDKDTQVVVTAGKGGETFVTVAPSSATVRSEFFQDVQTQREQQRLKPVEPTTREEFAQSLFQKQEDLAGTGQQVSVTKSGDGDPFIIKAPKSAIIRSEFAAEVARSRKQAESDIKFVGTIQVPRIGGTTPWYQDPMQKRTIVLNLSKAGRDFKSFEKGVAKETTLKYWPEYEEGFKRKDTKTFWDVLGGPPKQISFYAPNLLPTGREISAGGVILPISKYTIGKPVERGELAAQQFEKGAYEGIRERPVKAAVYFGAGVALTGVGTLAKLGSSTSKFALISAATPPVIKTVASTGIKVGLTTLYGSTIVAKAKATGRPIPEQFGRATTTEIIPLSAGILVGSEAISRGVSYYTTRGREFVPIEKLTPRDVLTGKERFPVGPQSKYKQLEIFKQNRYLLPGENPARPRAFHATASPFGQRVVTGGGDATSELPGFYVGPAVSPYFFKVSSSGQLTTISGEILPSAGFPTALRVYPKGFKVLTGSKESMTKFLLSQEAAKGYGYVPGIKTELEAIIPPGTMMTRTGQQFYTIWGGQRVPIDQYTVTGAGITGASGKSTVSLANLSSLYSGSKAALFYPTTGALSSVAGVVSSSSTQPSNVFNFRTYRGSSVQISSKAVPSSSSISRSFSPSRSSISRVSSTVSSLSSSASNISSGISSYSAPSSSSITSSSLANSSLTSSSLPSSSLASSSSASRSSSSSSGSSSSYSSFSRLSSSTSGSSGSSSSFSRSYLPPPPPPFFFRRDDRKLTAAFDVFVKRGGKFKRIASGLPRGKALRAGAEKVKSTLAATFKIEQRGVTSALDRPFKPSKDVFRTFKKKKGKKIEQQLTFIQKRAFRLSASSEKFEIQRALKIAR